MSFLRIEYDMNRGGFMLMVNGIEGRLPAGSFAGASIYKGQSGRIAKLESWRNLPLRRIHWSEFHYEEPPEVAVARRSPIALVARAAIDKREEAWQQFRGSRPSGDFTVKGERFRAGAFHLRQTPQDLTVWFSHGDDVPRAHWMREDDPNFGLSAWFSQRTIPQHKTAVERGCPPIRLLAGMKVAFDFTETTYPIRRLIVTPVEFKG